MHELCKLEWILWEVSWLSSTGKFLNVLFTYPGVNYAKDLFLLIFLSRVRFSNWIIFSISLFWRSIKDFLSSVSCSLLLVNSSSIVPNAWLNLGKFDL